MEVWKKIQGYDYYYISNYGNVISKKYNKTRILKKETSKGYLRVTFSKNNIQKRFLVHRLVAEHFIQNKKNKPCVNHINGNKKENFVYNLEWCTHSENENHSYNVLGKINPIRKLKKLDVIFIKTNAVKGRNGNIKTLSNKFNVDVSTIYNVLKNKYYV